MVECRLRRYLETVKAVERYRKRLCARIMIGCIR